MKRSPLRRRVGLRSRSKKRERLMRQRRAFVSTYLQEHPYCEIPKCWRVSVDVHEKKSRARGGSILDPDNVVALCRAHHDLVHRRPAWAERVGLLVPSWGDA